MAAITQELIAQKLQAQFGQDILSIEAPYDLLTIEVQKNRILEVLRWIHEDDTLRFRFLTDITGLHYPEEKGREIGVVYHVHSLENNIRLRLKCFLPIEKPEIESATPLYAGANWMERETYDFFGVIFTGHPNLKRILNVDEMDYFPLRKEYPLEDGTRTDKEDKYFGR